MITLTWLTKFWFLLLIAGVILLNSVYLKGNYLKHFFDFGELKRIAQKIKDESNYLGKSVIAFLVQSHYLPMYVFIWDWWV